MTDLQTRIREFLAAAKDPASLTTTREHLKAAVELLRDMDGAFAPLEAPAYTCKFCGAPSWFDPSEQTAPPDYCHESDHGTPEDRL